MALVTGATGLGAQSVETAKLMALRTVMEKLGRDMQAVTGAISKEEWALVAELAPELAIFQDPAKLSSLPSELLQLVHPAFL